MNQNNMAAIDIKGLGVALVTPFKKDKSIDFEALSRVLEHVTGNGADFLVVLGTTGETPTLTEAEKEQVRRFVVEKNAGRLPLVLGKIARAASRLLRHKP